MSGTGIFPVVIRPEDVLKRLVEHRTMGSAPREEVAWLVEHGRMRILQPGDVLSTAKMPVEGLHVIFNGQVVIHVERGGGRRKVMEWREGDVTGVLPYSRLTGLADVSEQDYDLLEGPFAAIYGRSAACPFVIQMSTAADLTASAAGALRRQASADGMVADFGCGRVTAGATAIDAGTWSELGRFADRAGGHAVLEKAPDEFKKDRDVFGTTRPEWKVMHRIKDILDPKHIFSPGRLPGRV